MPDMQSASIAASRAVFAAPHSPPPAGVTPGLGSLAEVVLALIVVLTLIMVIAWLARRMRVNGVDGSTIQILAEKTIGPKERAVLLEVRGRQFLVGVAAGSVTTLHVFDGNDASGPFTTEGVTQVVLDDERPSFSSLLRRSLGLR